VNTHVCTLTHIHTHTYLPARGTGVVAAVGVGALVLAHTTPARVREALLLVLIAVLADPAGLAVALAAPYSAIAQ
jgi:hypothetical protein